MHEANIDKWLYNLFTFVKTGIPLLTTKII